MNGQQPEQVRLSRRQFMTHGTAAAAGESCVSPAFAAKAAQPAAVAADYDVIVCGGSTAGLPAAILNTGKRFNRTCAMKRRETERCLTHAQGKRVLDA